MRLRQVFLGLTLCCAGVALALDFRSVAEPAVIAYEAPAKDARKLFILSRDYPVEVVISTNDGWVRVRDDTGAFGWVEARSLTDRRTVMVKSQTIDVHAAPNESAAVAFRAEQGVTLEFLGYSAGWANVKHRSGTTGFVRPGDLWGL